MLKRKLLAALEKRCQWNPAGAVVVGVSGGADSVALLHALVAIQADVIVGHFNHHLREAADMDADFVASQCKQLGVTFALGGANVRELASRQHLGVEEAARQARYDFLFELARKAKAQAVVTAHHADDQVETILMHFLRGSGLDGLVGMPYRGILRSFDSDIPVYRPLLDVGKAELSAYCEQENLDYVVDETNADDTALRNRLRNTIIPYLETSYPGLRSTIIRNAKALEADRELLMNLEQKAFEACLDSRVENGLLLQRDRVLSLDNALQKRVIRHSLQQILVDLRDFGLDLLETIQSAIASGQTFLPLTNGLSLWRIGNKIQILPSTEPPILVEFPQLSAQDALIWQDHKDIYLGSHWVLKREVLQPNVYETLPVEIRVDPLHAWVSVENPTQELVVRSPKTGEALALLGMIEGKQKLSDFFINNKIPQPARTNWPLVAEGDSIIWLVGLRTTQPYRLTQESAAVLHLWVEQVID